MLPAQTPAEPPPVTTRRSEVTRASVMAAFGAWIGFLTGPNVMVSSTNSNFMAVLPGELHASRAAISTGLAVSVWAVALLGPFAGRAMDRFGVRRVLIPGSILFGAMFLLFSQITSLWQFVVLQALFAIPNVMHSSVGYAKVVSMWFDQHRGKVLGLCVALGAGLGQTIMPKLSRYLIDHYGWRAGYLGIAAIILLVGLPLIVLLVRTPAYAPPVHEPQVDASGEPLGVVAPLSVEDTQLPGLTRAEALRKPAFYMVFFAIMFGSMSLLGTLQHAVPMITDRGLSASVATTVMSLSFLGVIIGEFSSGLLVDRLNTPRIVLPFFGSALVGLMIVHTAITPEILYVGAVMMGLGLGGEIGQNAYLVSRYFGLRNFGAIYGLTFAASNLGIGFGLILMGWVRDYAGTYAPMRYVFGATMTTSVLCIAMLPRFTFAARKVH